MRNRLVLVSCILALLAPLALSAGEPYEDLHTAIRRQSIDEAEDAIKRGAKVDVLVLINSINRSPEMLKAMLKHYDGDIDASHGQINMSALGAATVADNAVAAEILLDAGADMDKPAAYGLSAWETASSGIARKPKVLALLTARRKPDTGNVTPESMYHAALAGDFETVTSMLAAGADPNGSTKPAKKKKRGNTALHGAAQGGHEDIVDVLLGAGADPDKRGPDGVTTLMYAAQSGDAMTVMTVLDSGVDPDERDDHGYHAIYHSGGVDDVSDALMAVSEELQAWQEVPELEEGDEVEAGQLVRLPCDRSGSHAGPHYCGQSGVFRSVAALGVKGIDMQPGYAPPQCEPVRVVDDYELTIFETAYRWQWKCRPGPRTTGDAGPGWVQMIASLDKEEVKVKERTVKGKARKQAKPVKPPKSETTVTITQPVAGAQFTYNQQTPGVLTIDVVADIQPERCKENVTWTMNMGTSTLVGYPRIEHGQLFFQELPEDNSNFGDVDITASACGVTSAPVTVQIFYPAQSRNHPGPEQDITPNWFYYWHQTVAGRPFTGANAPVYRLSRTSQTVEGAATAGGYDHATDTIVLTDVIFGVNGCFTRPATTSGLDGRPGPPVAYPGQRSDGIDCYAETLRHEVVHRRERHQWWGNKDPVQIQADDPAEYALLDSDFDKVPNIAETRYNDRGRGCNYVFAVGRKSCTGRPTLGGIETIDLELNAYRVGWATWNPTAGTADPEDWGVWMYKGRCTVHPDPTRNKWRDAGPCPW